MICLKSGRVLPVAFFFVDVDVVVCGGDTSCYHNLKTLEGVQLNLAKFEYVMGERIH